MDELQDAKAILGLPEGGRAWIQVLGSCMAPLFKSGDSVLVERFGSVQAARGDIVVVRLSDGTLRAHLAISDGARARTSTLRGAEDPPGGAVIARVVAVRRRGFSIPLPSSTRLTLVAVHQLFAGVRRSPSVRRRLKDLRSIMVALSAPIRRRLLEPISVRPLTFGDAQRLIWFAGDVAADAVAGIKTGLLTSWAREGTAFGAFDRRGELVGFFRVAPCRAEGLDLDGWWAPQLMVGTFARRLGVAQRLIEAVTARASELGATDVYSCVSPTNQGSVRAHESCGFRHAPQPIQEAVLAAFARSGHPGPWSVLHWSAGTSANVPGSLHR